LARLTGDPAAKKAGKEKVVKLKTNNAKLVLRSDGNQLWQKQANQPNMRTFKPVRKSNKLSHAT
jgi:hypothetical protein